jgi:hypothetical protein
MGFHDKAPEKAVESSQEQVGVVVPVTGLYL